LLLLAYFLLFLATNDEVWVLWACCGLGVWPQEGDESFDNGLWETYGCTAGSLVVFSEAVRHTGSDWTHAENPRCAILMACEYSTDCAAQASQVT
jgi:hypothetical protein